MDSSMTFFVPHCTSQSCFLIPFSIPSIFNSHFDVALPYYFCNHPSASRLELQLSGRCLLIYILSSSLFVCRYLLFVLHSVLYILRPLLRAISLSFASQYTNSADASSPTLLHHRFFVAISSSLFCRCFFVIFASSPLPHFFFFVAVPSPFLLFHPFITFSSSSFLRLRCLPPVLHRYFFFALPMSHFLFAVSLSPFFVAVSSILCFLFLFRIFFDAIFVTDFFVSIFLLKIPNCHFLLTFFCWTFFVAISRYPSFLFRFFIAIFSISPRPFVGLHSFLSFVCYGFFGPVTSSAILFPASLSTFSIRRSLFTISSVAVPTSSFNHCHFSYTFSLSPIFHFHFFFAISCLHFLLTNFSTSFHSSSCFFINMSLRTFLHRCLFAAKSFSLSFPTATSSPFVRHNFLVAIELLLFLRRRFCCHFRFSFLRHRLFSSPFLYVAISFSGSFFVAIVLSSSPHPRSLPAVFGRPFFVAVF